MGNHLYYGDNLRVLRDHIASDSVDLIYLDPPFNSNASYNVLFKGPQGSDSAAQIEAFDDTWHWNDSAEEAFGEVMRGGNGCKFPAVDNFTILVIGIGAKVMRLLAFCFVSFLFAMPVLAQEMKPLSELVDSAAISYPPARCAGLYQAVMEWTGEDRMGAEVWSRTNSSRESLIFYSVLLGQSKSGRNIEDEVDIVIRDVRNIADLYLARMERNYAAGGQAFGEDRLIIKDLSTCKSIAEAMPQF